MAWEAVTVVHVLVAEAYLEYAVHDDFLETVAHQERGAGVFGAAGKLGDQRKVLFLPLKQKQAAMLRQVHCVGRGLQLEIIYCWEANFFRKFLAFICKMTNFAHVRFVFDLSLQE